MRYLVRCASRYVRENWLVRLYSSTTAPSLRPYQLECIEAIHNALNRRQRPAVSLPTGSGKTRIFTHLLRNVQPMHAEDVERTKVLVIVNRKELMDQAALTISQAHTDLSVNLLNSQNLYDARADVVVSTYQSLASHNAWRLHQIDPAEFKLIIIDEAHHSVANSYFTVLEHFNAVGPASKPEKPQYELAKFLEDVKLGDPLTPRSDDVIKSENRRPDHPNRRVHVVGFSATFWRSDHEFLSDVYDEVCFHETVDQMIRDGFLCSARLQQISLPPQFQHYERKVKARDFFLGSVSESSSFLYDIWAANDTKYHHTVIFAINTTQISAIVECFRQNGVDARYMVGHMTIREREDTINAFKNGEFPVLVNCQILTEGTDLPLIDQIIIARGLGSKGLAMQIVGRGLRLHLSKTHCNIVVFPDFQQNFEGGFLPQLMSVEKQEGNSLSVRDRQLETPEPFVNYREMMSTNQDFDVNLLSFDDYLPEDPRSSILQWIPHNQSFYLFPRLQNCYFVIDRPSDSKLWCFASVIRLGKKFTQRHEHFKSKSLCETTRFADQNLKIRLDYRTHRAVLANARWQQQPPSEKQLKYLRTKNDSLNYRKLNRGTATHVISLLGIGCKLSQKLVDSVASSEPNSEPNHNELNRKMRELGI